MAFVRILLGAERRWNALAAALLAAAGILVLVTFADYGVTWDEDVHNWYGVFALDYYLSLFSDQRALNWLNLYNYGAAFDMTAAAFNKFSPLGIYETRHLLNGLVGLVGLAGCWKLGRALGEPRAGFLALLFLLLTPNYYGQMFNNPKDIPFAVGGVWATYYMVRILPSLPYPPWRLLLKMGLAIGLALGVRVGGLLFLCYLGLLLGLSAAWQGIAARRLSVFITTGLTNLWRVLLPVAGVAFALMLVFWPWAQQDPLGHPLRALAFFSHETFPFKTLFDGRFVPASDLPWTYLPTYILLALPELVLVLLAAAAVLAVVALARRDNWGRRETVLGHFLLGLAIVFPVTYAIAIKAVLFDGMRHFISTLPCADLRRARALRDRAYRDDGDAAPRPVCLLQRLCRRRRRRAAQVQARLLGQFLCRGGAWPRGLPEARIRRGFRGARVHCGRVRPADLGALLFPGQFPARAPAGQGRILHRFHERRLRPPVSGDSGLPRRAHGRALIHGSRPARHHRRAAHGQAAGGRRGDELAPRLRLPLTE
ncbi:MAG: hypothetical protein AUG47_01265 [Alphaproteobacteria bacterium 13_1_20CM_3_64_12]|nr:MAG: hypothetical protein AUG47_01265 [Alphaproteobacteria bacterium 13_1_20CM_3_64_12]